jgi:hypothetical protein
MNIKPISNPLPGEHIAATSPVMRPESEATFRHRLNFWAGRALTTEAFELEQANRAGQLASRGYLVTAGITQGLEVALEVAAETPPNLPTLADHFIHVLPGHGFTAAGEDVVVPRALRVPLEDLALFHVRLPSSPPDDIPGLPAEFNVVNIGGTALHVHRFPAGTTPTAAILIARPTELRAFGNLDPEDPCEIDLSRDAFADERRIDGAQFSLVTLPVNLTSAPELGAAPNDPRWRNRLAHVLFSAETRAAARQYLRFLASRPMGDRWDTVQIPAPQFLWEMLGVPLALVGIERPVGAARSEFFLDRGSVARPGGLAKYRTRPAARLATETSDQTLNPPGAGDPSVWRARVDQFAEQLGSLESTDPAFQAQHFQFLPAAGLLPRNSLDFLTTDEAEALPPSIPGAAPDRAALSRFFPASFAVEAVPVATEDLDSLLAASAPLAPYDLAAPGGDVVRMLVPVPQRVFDPKVLLVEQEDPIFAMETARLIAARQDWRQRRDSVRNRRDQLQSFVSGPLPVTAQPALEAGQLEPEPVETLANLAFGGAFLSPIITLGPWEVRSNFLAVPIVSRNTTLFVLARLDQENPPVGLEIRFRSQLGDSSEELPFIFTAAPNPPLPVVLDGQPQATPLWVRFTVTGEQLGIATEVPVAGFTFRLEGGRVALAAVGRLVPGQLPGDLVEDPFWRATDTAPIPEFVGGTWERISGARLLSPFEEAFEPAFPDNLTLDQRLTDLDTGLGLVAPNRVRETGLDRVIQKVQDDLNRADDKVDLGFLKTQTNIHRIRQLIMGEDVANDLLTSPSIASIVKTKSSRVAQDKLQSALKSAQVAQAQPAIVSGAAAPSTAERLVVFQPFTGVNAANFRDLTTSNETIKLETSSSRFAETASIKSTFETAPTRADILAAEPAAGQTFELRTLTIAKRFNTDATRNSFNYADAALRELLEEVAVLDLGYRDDDMIPDALDAAGAPVSFRRLFQGGRAFVAQLRFPGIADSDDSSAIFSRGLRRSDTSVLILRKIEAYVARRRELLLRARDVLVSVRQQIGFAGNRVLVIEGRLAEARHDVSVARALWDEEKQRVDEVNDRRDALLRDEVKFLAYARPRSVEFIRRNTPAWKLDSADAVALVPACLRRHDDPADALEDYLQLFRQAPAKWFTRIRPLLLQLNTRDHLFQLLDTAQQSAARFLDFGVRASMTQAPDAVKFTYAGALENISTLRASTAALKISDTRARTWKDFHIEAEKIAALGDLANGRHGKSEISSIATAHLAQIGQVATCLHAEFGAVAPATRLIWVQRFSQFDRAASFRDLSILPNFHRLDRASRRRLQSFADWLFNQIDTTQAGAVSLINDLVRICLLLASHAPVNRIIAGHVPRPVPVRPGILIPIKPLNPGLVRVGMEFHVWHNNHVIARGNVEDLNDGEVTSRVKHVATSNATIDPGMRIQFVAPGLSLIT